MSLFLLMERDITVDPIYQTKKCEYSIMVQFIPVDLCKLTFNPLVRAEQGFKVRRNEMESQRILMLWLPFLEQMKQVTN